ncbi:hypothetical protein CEXT_591481, partial [Caerostris extrusa]
MNEGPYIVLILNFVHWTRFHQCFQLILTASSGAETDNVAVVEHSTE